MFFKLLSCIMIPSPHSHMGMYIYIAVSTKEWSVVTTRDTLSPFSTSLMKTAYIYDTELTENLGVKGRSCKV